jgi:hypothetical protein
MTHFRAFLTLFPLKRPARREKISPIWRTPGDDVIAWRRCKSSIGSRGEQKNVHQQLRWNGQSQASVLLHEPLIHLIALEMTDGAVSEITWEITWEILLQNHFKITPKVDRFLQMGQFPNENKHQFFRALYVHNSKPLQKFHDLFTLYKCTTYSGGWLFVLQLTCHTQFL